MEGQFRINWPAIVEEAKQRRKAQRLTQQQLAELAGVSTPTISHFETGKKDIQLSTINNILKVLGMLDERTLSFPDPDPHYDRNIMSVRFEGRDGDRQVDCAISREALKDHFGDSEDLVRIFNANQQRIEAEARRKYFARSFGVEGPVLIETADLYR